MILNAAASKPEPVHADGSAGNGGWVCNLSFCGGFEEKRERSAGGVIYFPPSSEDRCGLVTPLRQTATKSSLQPVGVEDLRPPATRPRPHVRSQERGAGQTRKTTSSRCHNSPLDKQQLGIGPAELRYPLFFFCKSRTVCIFLCRNKFFCSRCGLKTKKKERENQTRTAPIF